jgi:hypothetical protein
MHIAQFLTFSVLLLIARESCAADAVVLVTGAESSIEGLSSLDIRKAYLGIKVTVDGVTVRPIRRGEDERLNQIFMQSVIAMSHRSYERRLLSLALKFGTPRPTEAQDQELIELLARHPDSITYMWRSDADSDPRVKTIEVLWQEN